MCGTCKGFTLIEVLIALSVIAVAFTILLEILSLSRKSYEGSVEMFRKVVYLDRKLKERDHEGIQVRKERLPDFPSIEEVTYTYEGIFFVQYREKR